METNSSCNETKQTDSDAVSIKSAAGLKSIRKSAKAVQPKAACGCGESSAEASPCGSYIVGKLKTPVGDIPQISTTLTACDQWGAFKARWDINRMDYKVAPGLYGIGTPDASSPVLVTANYKLTFDALRKELTGLNAYVLVLDTKGINVWCAAGKGTFGTKELVKRIRSVKLDQVVDHRTLILPQLGAVGVSAHEVKKHSGFSVVYGPVRACDLPAFLADGLRATREMRTVRFTAKDRLILTPVELAHAFKPLAFIYCALFVLNVLGLGQYGMVDFYAWLGTFVVGTVLTPFLLPWIPGRAFSFKGMLLGLLWTAGVIAMNGGLGFGLLKGIAYLLVLPSISAYAAMNFTGCSTYTSMSGVNKEMKIALPMMLISVGLGVLLLLADGIRLAVGY